MGTKPERTPEKIRERLVRLLTDFKDELKSADLRKKVVGLVSAFEMLSDLGSSVIPSEKAGAARDRILHYFRKYPRTVIRGEELMVVAGISEWARRVRELRVQEGWPIINGMTAREMTESEDLELEGQRSSDMRVDTYVLLEDKRDADAAGRWRLANEIRKTDSSIRDKILRYLRKNVGKVIMGDELRYVADDKTEWARRVRELRTEFGWPISTQYSGRPELPSGAYVLERDAQAPVHDRKIPDPVRRAVLLRDKYACRKCGWNRKLWDPSDPRHLELHHVKQHALGGGNEADNLVTLCNVCHDAEPVESKKNDG